MTCGRIRGWGSATQAADRSTRGMVSWRARLEQQSTAAHDAVSSGLAPGVKCTKLPLKWITIITYTDRRRQLAKGSMDMVEDEGTWQCTTLMRVAL